MASQINRRNFSTLLAASAFLPIVVRADSSGRPESYDKIGQSAPNFSLQKLGGGIFDNKSLKGKTTIVEFWGLWCPDCLRDGDNVAALAQKLKGNKKIKFMSVHTRGRYGRWGSVEAYFAEKNYSYPVAIDDDSKAYKAFELKWVPSFIIIDKNGKIADYTTELDVGIGVDGLIAKAKKVAGIKT